MDRHKYIRDSALVPTEPQRNTEKSQKGGGGWSKRQRHKYFRNRESATGRAEGETQSDSQRWRDKLRQSRRRREERTDRDIDGQIHS